MNRRWSRRAGALALLAVLLLSFTVSASAASSQLAGKTTATKPNRSIETAGQATGHRVWLPMVVHFAPAIVERDVLLIIDEDSLDNGIRYNASGGSITTDGPNFFTATEVNDDIAAIGQRAVLRYFAANRGRSTSLMTGQTGDEGWFAPTCVPQRWLSGSGDDCIDPASPNFKLAIDRFWAGAVPQDPLDKTPHVMPLRALGLDALVHKDICAVVYDSDISINYDHDDPLLGVNGNLKGETLGVVAFRVVATATLGGFSSSTLPQVRLTITDPSACGEWQLLNAPVPESSSIPNDRTAPGSSSGYLRVMQWPALPEFFPQ